VKFRDGAPEGIGCILGRNALNRSYVTGYGARASHRYYSRWYTSQLDPTLALSYRPARSPAGSSSSAQCPLGC
jgi:endoglucanase